MIKKIVLVVLIAITFTSCKKGEGSSTHQSINTEKINFTKEGTLTFYDSTRTTVLQKLNIEVAKTEYEQETGLMYRKHMKEDQGMLFIYTDERPRPNFYMKNTYIGLDLVYINAAHKVVDINENAKPLDETPIPSTAPAQYVLEINAGMAEQWGLKVGDKVSFHID